MELIQPAEISGKIMTLFDQAKEEIIIISPYNKFTHWKKLTQRIKKAKDRGVNIKWFIRKNVENNANQIREIGIEPIEIENLHCKIYLNEMNAVVTSMNLHEFSDSSSIDIGYFIQDNKQYKELTDFINIHIDCYRIAKKPNPKILEFIDTEKLNFQNILENYLIAFGIEKQKLQSTKNGRGTILKINQFVGDFELIFEPRNNFYRIDLRIKYPYKLRDKLYNYLDLKEDELNQEIGFKIKFGNQMKRLKLDLKLFENIRFNDWSFNEFEEFKPFLSNVLIVYKKYITEALAECL